VHSISLMCRALQISESGYHAWRTRPVSKHARRDGELLDRVRAIHDGSRATYGAPRVHAELAADGIQISRKRVARIMRGAGLVGASRRKWCTTTKSDGSPVAPDLLKRDFKVGKLDQLWVADITYVPTWAGFLYLAIVLDACSRRVVGWAMATHLRTELVLDAFNMALGQRKPNTSVIHHSDHGTQYTSIAFGLRCRAANVKPSMGTVGDAYDNAMAESFFATLECELLDRRKFQTHVEARMAIFEFIEGWYNPRRRHSALGYMSPAEFERKAAA
jgi:putative transposase